MRLIYFFAACLIVGQTGTAALAGESNAAAGGYSAAALFNRGNACARDGKTGLAVLNYERAQLLAPNDADIAANLHFVRGKAGLPDASESRLTRGLSWAAPNTSAWLGSFGLVLACAGILMVRIYPPRRGVFRASAFAGALLVATAMGSAAAMWPKASEAVIMVRETPARTSPARAAETLFKLREGETVTVRAEHQDFSLVQTAAGRSGWVDGADLSRVVIGDAVKTGDGIGGLAKAK
jgi:hypothetical protein